MNQKSFKEKLISIKQEFFNYLKVNACQGIPAKVYNILNIGIEYNFTKIFS